MAKTKTSSKGAAPAGGQGSAKGWKKSERKATAFEPFNLNELAQLIQASELSLGKKMGYLYMIARGTFSTGAFEGLMKDIDTAGESLEKEKTDKEAEVASLQQEVDELEAQMPALQYLEAVESYQNMDKLIEKVAREEEKTEIESKKAKLKKKK